LHRHFRFSRAANTPRLEATNIVDLEFFASARQRIVRFNAHDMVVFDLVFETGRESGLDLRKAAKWHSTRRHEEMSRAHDAVDDLIL
jgi:hypothetical protein